MNIGRRDEAQLCGALGAVIRFTGELRGSVWERCFRCRGHLFRIIMRCQWEILWPEQAITELRKMGYKTAVFALTDNSASIDDPNLKPVQ